MRAVGSKRCQVGTMRALGSVFASSFIAALSVALIFLFSFATLFREQKIMTLTLPVESVSHGRITNWLAWPERSQSCSKRIS